MSYQTSYFEPMPDWENDFDTVKVHSEEIKNIGHEGTLLSYTLARASNNTVVFPFDKTIAIDALDLYPGFSMDGATNGQKDMKHSQSLLLAVKHRGRTVIRYDPIGNVLQIPDIYHDINDYTEKVLTLCKKLINNWTEHIETGEPDGKYAIFNGQAYRLEPTANLQAGSDLEQEFKEIGDKFDEAVEQVKQDNETSVSLSKTQIDRLINAGISVYSTNRSCRLIAVKKVDYEVSHLVKECSWAVELPESDRVEDSARVKLVLKPIEDEKTRKLGHYVINVQMDTPHPHRDSDTRSGFKDVCTGDLSMQIHSVDDLVEHFTKFKEALEVINLESPYSSIGGYKNYKSTSEYRGMYDRIKEEA